MYETSLKGKHTHYTTFYQVCLSFFFMMVFNSLEGAYKDRMALISRDLDNSKHWPQKNRLRTTAARALYHDTDLLLFATLLFRHVGGCLVFLIISVFS